MRRHDAMTARPIFLIALIVAVFAWVLSLKDQIADLQAQLSSEQLKHEQQARDAFEALALAHAEIREQEHQHARQLADIDSRHQQEFADAQTAADRTVAGLRNGTLRLREQLAEIGRAVQQECRDRSRMPSSA
eukprot:TRINITY_DN5424_c0_g1_i3.p1 TRINITY_DN5424_c0_g1~~TRINITY_DN5424_c0_g1_i3.p1  ORF type:complete len:133 (-),score=38.43 TRINITY_DN5424_c0_g1_i3:11-409(-)